MNKQQQEQIHDIITLLKDSRGKIGRSALINALRIRNSIELNEQLLHELVRLEVIEYNSEGITLLERGWRYQDWDSLMTEIELDERRRQLEDKLLETNVSNALSVQSHRTRTKNISIIALVVSILAFVVPLLFQYFDAKESNKDFKELQERIWKLENSSKLNENGRAPMRQEIDSVAKPLETQQNHGIQEK